MNKRTAILMNHLICSFSLKWFLNVMSNHSSRCKKKIIHSLFVYWVYSESSSRNCYTTDHIFRFSTDKITLQVRNDQRYFISFYFRYRFSSINIYLTVISAWLRAVVFTTTSFIVDSAFAALLFLASDFTWWTFCRWRLTRW